MFAVSGIVCGAIVLAILVIWLRSPGTTIAVGEKDWPMQGGGSAHLSYLSLAPGAQIGELWGTRLEGEPVGPPAVAGGRVYVACGNGHLYCLDLATGRPLWRHDAGGTITSMPAVFERGILLATADGRVRSVSPEGKFIWEKEVGGAVSSSPIPDGGSVFFGSADHHLYCLDAGDGDEKWSFRADGPVEVSPCVYDGQVFGVSYEGDLFALEAGSGRLLWTFQSHGVPVSAPVADDGRIFLSTEFETFCLDSQSGKLLWEYATGPTVISNPALRGNQLILVIGGEGLLSNTLSLDARTGDKVWSVASGITLSRTWLFATNQYVYLSGLDRLTALSTESGAPAFEVEIAGLLPHTLTMTEERVLFTAQNRKVHCYAE